jgi:hypothetical protein
MLVEEGIIFTATTKREGAVRGLQSQEKEIRILLHPPTHPTSNMAQGT